MRITLKEIARCIGGTVTGDEEIVITGIAGIREACEGDITFLANSRYLPLLNTTRASAVIVPPDVSGVSKPVIRTANPSLAFSKLIEQMTPQDTSRPVGIHPSAVVGENVKLGKNVALGPCVVVENNAVVGDNTVICAGSFIGHHTAIGSDTLIYPNVSVREHVSIGSRVIIHSGTVIGSDGFGFVTVEGKHQKIPQVGTVQVGNDVEIGANVAIDRARFSTTVIADGTKIDNLVQIAHNVMVGENSLIVAQAGISGSTVIGRNVTIAGQAGLVGHIKIGDEAIIAAQAGVTKSVAAGTLVSGYPARPHETAKKVNACVQNLPRLYEEITQLKKRIAELEEKLRMQVKHG